MFVAAKIMVEENNVMALPESAFVKDKSAFLFRYISGSEKGHVFEKHVVETGLEANGFIEILYSGLPEDARVATSGVYYINSELQKSLE